MWNRGINSTFRKLLFQFLIEGVIIEDVIIEGVIIAYGVYMITKGLDHRYDIGVKCQGQIYFFKNCPCAHLLSYSFLEQ